MCKQHGASYLAKISAPVEPVTATAAAIDSAESNAALKAVAHALEDALETALQMTADYVGLGEGGGVEVYDEFAEPPPQGIRLEPWREACRCSVAPQGIASSLRASKANS